KCAPATNLKWNGGIARPENISKCAAPNLGKKAGTTFRSGNRLRGFSCCYSQLSAKIRGETGRENVQLLLRALSFVCLRLYNHSRRSVARAGAGAAWNGSVDRANSVADRCRRDEARWQRSGRCGCSRVCAGGRLSVGGESWRRRVHDDPAQ